MESNLVCLPKTDGMSSLQMSKDLPVKYDVEFLLLFPEVFACDSKRSRSSSAYNKRKHDVLYKFKIVHLRGIDGFKLGKLL